MSEVVSGCFPFEVFVKLTGVDVELGASGKVDVGEGSKEEEAGLP
jgi:hypothetical protein